MDINRILIGMAKTAAPRPWNTRTGHVKAKPKAVEKPPEEEKLPEPLSMTGASDLMGLGIGKHKADPDTFKSYGRGLFGWALDKMVNNNVGSIQSVLGTPISTGDPMSGNDRIRAIIRGLLGSDASAEDVERQLSAYDSTIVQPTLKNRKDMPWKDWFSNMYPAAKGLSDYRYVLTDAPANLGGYNSSFNKDIVLNNVKGTSYDNVPVAIHETVHSVNDGYPRFKGTASGKSLAPGFLAGTDALSMDKRLDQYDIAKTFHESDTRIRDANPWMKDDPEFAGAFPAPEKPSFHTPSGYFGKPGTSSRDYILGGAYFLSDVEVAIPIHIMQQISVNAGLKPPEGHSKWTFRELLSNMDTDDVKSSAMYKNLMAGSKNTNMLNNRSLGISNIMEINATYKWMIENYDRADSLNGTNASELGIFKYAEDALKDFREHGGTKDQLLKDYNEWLDNMDKMTQYVAQAHSSVPGALHA